jgi:hypothetical protein
MASPQGAQKIRSEYNLVTVVSTADITTEVAVPVSEAGVAATWFDMRDYEAALVQVVLHTRADNIEVFSIQGATSSAGANAADIVDHADPTGCNAASDWVVLEISAEQLAQEGADAGVAYRYIAASVKTGNSSDRVTINIFAKAKRPHLDLADDYSS